jgi:hypothetical protein
VSYERSSGSRVVCEAFLTETSPIFAPFDEDMKTVKIPKDLEGSVYAVVMNEEAWWRIRAVAEAEKPTRSPSSPLDSLHPFTVVTANHPRITHFWPVLDPTHISPSDLPPELGVCDYF